MVCAFNEGRLSDASNTLARSRRNRDTPTEVHLPISPTFTVPRRKSECTRVEVAGVEPASEIGLRILNDIKLICAGYRAYARITYSAPVTGVESHD
jgi:hypothetical protein